ncbi:T9SS type A sorting domain-containing protein [Rasiella sp. SM2506]|uniref:T9SS type A sorting domain-containing protein n=1 Tax=Rasiella sp. SM2506 TaxID=3423914 RepID=UPI003D79FA84
MKTKLPLIVAFLSFISMNAQFGPQQIISSETNKAYLSIPVDIDNDGFIDILSAQAENLAMVWFRNLDGLGNFGPKTTISSNSALYLSINYVDIDTDGDKDILLIENNPREVRWIEHLDGQGNFATEEIVLITNPETITDIRTLDFDNDGDLDILANVNVDINGDEIVWYENLDGSGNFGSENILATTDEGFHPPLLVDIDVDGDLDILTSKEGITISRIVWYENLGNAQVSSEKVIFEYDPFTNTTTMLYADIDTDGKEDIVITYYDDINEYRHGWMKNLNNDGTYDTPKIIMHLNETATYNLYDLDADSDIDVLLWNRDTGTISWIENSNGLGVFNPKRTITTEVDFPRDAQAADIDGDGLLDVVSASLADDKVAWYKNSGILNIDENNYSTSSLYPNPTADKVYFDTPEIIETATVYDALGITIKTLKRPSEIDMGALSTGIYFVSIITETGQTSVQKIIKK